MEISDVCQGQTTEQLGQLGSYPNEDQLTLTLFFLPPLAALN